MTLTSAGCAAADALSQVRLVVGEDLNIHTMNGKGDEFHEVVLRRKTGGTQRGALWDAYFQPSLAPDGGAVACIRFRNYTRLSSNDPALLPRQSSEIVIFLRLILPLGLPAIASLAIFQFLWTWNDLIVALTFGQYVQPITVWIFGQLREFATSIDVIAPASFISLVVPLTVFFAFQRYFVQGLLAGSVK